MTIVVDASALVAMATREPEADALGKEIHRHLARFCCSVGLWEAARAVARKQAISASEAGLAVDRLLNDFGITLIPLGAAEARLALEAHDRFGKGTGHPAQLNMGDCFAYACAKANGARLLYKGGDFAETDLA